MLILYIVDWYFILWRACNLTAFTHSSTGPVVHPFASHHEGHRFNPQGGYLGETGILLLALSYYISDPDMIDQCGPVWDRLCPKPSLGRRADNVIILLDLAQLFCPSFTLLAGPPSSFGCWGGALWRACNLTAFTHSSTGSVVHTFASRPEPGFNPKGGTYVKTGFSCQLCLATIYKKSVNLTLIQMAITKCDVVRLWVINDSQATNRKQGGLPVRSCPPSYHTPIGRLEIIYDPQPTGTHKNTTTNRCRLLLF
jgi:hypothetical protein